MVLTGTAHVIPLSDAAMAVLDNMRKRQEAEGIINSEFVFHGEKGPHLSLGAPGQLLQEYFLKRMKAFDFSGKMTVHGFRTCFKSWAIDHGKDETDSEMALAHTIGTSVRNIYARDAQRIEQRRPMMQAWADHCAGPLPAGANVIPYKQAKSR